MNAKKAKALRRALRNELPVKVLMPKARYGYHRNELTNRLEIKKVRVEMVPRGMNQAKQLEIDHPIRQPWTDRHRQILKDMYPHIGTAKVAYAMRRSIKSIYSEAQRLGVRKASNHKSIEASK